MGLKNVVKKHGFQGIITLLLLTLIGIYTYALRQQNAIADRLIQTQIQCSVNKGRIGGFEKSLEERTKSMQRELEQRTQAMQTEMDGISKQFQSQVASLERLITTLVAVIRENGAMTRLEGG